MVDKSNKSLNPLTEKRVDELITSLKELEANDKSKSIEFSEGDIFQICNSVIEVFRSEESLLKVKGPINVAGDIHGQFYDLGKIFEIGGDPSTNKYLFLGDYVDRGMFSIEVITYLFCLKLVYPTTVYLMRGNHECRQLTTFFNFKQECEIKYDLEVYEKLMVSFDVMPLSCLINDKFPCVHGGLSPRIKKVR